MAWCHTLSLLYRTDGEEERFTALSDTELEINERNSARKHNSLRRKDFSTKVRHTLLPTCLAPPDDCLCSTGRGELPRCRQQLL